LRSIGRSSRELTAWIIATEGKHPMRIVPSALAAAALLAGVATAVVAQAPPAATNPNTKVYAYSKTAPQAVNPNMNAYPGTMASQQKPFEYLQGSVPYGSPKWWEITGQSSHGGSD
jgi:hypothetical protein